MLTNLLISLANTKEASATLDVRTSGLVAYSIGAPDWGGLRLSLISGRNTSISAEFTHHEVPICEF